jgi:hypothetical protein
MSARCPAWWPRLLGVSTPLDFSARGFHVPLPDRPKHSGTRPLRRLATVAVATATLLLAACGAGGPSRGYPVSTSVRGAPLVANAQALQGTVDVKIATGDTTIGDLRVGIERTTDRHALDAQRQHDTSADDFFPFFLYYPYFFNSTTVDRGPVVEEEPVEQAPPEAEEAPPAIVDEPPAEAPEPVEEVPPPEVVDPVEEPPAEEPPAEEPPIEEPAPIEEEGMAVLPGGDSQAIRLAADRAGAHDGVTLVRVTGDADARIVDNQVDLGKVGPRQRIDIRVVYLVPRGTNDVATIVLGDGSRDVIVPGGRSTDAWPDREMG